MYGSFDIKKTGASLCYQNYINIRNLHNNIIHKHYWFYRLYCTYYNQDFSFRYNETQCFGYL